MFQEAVRDFARSEIAPKVMEMDEAQQMDRGIIDQLFELGLMGIEIPEAHGGTGADFFTSVLVVEELSKVDPSIGVLVDVQNTLVINAILRWANDEQKARFFPRLASDTVGAYALSEAGSGSDAFALSCRAAQDGDDWVINGQKRWITNGNEAGLFIVFARRRRRLLGHHGVHGREGHGRLHRRQKGGQARHPRLLHHGARFRGCPGARRERPR